MESLDSPQKGRVQGLTLLLAAWLLIPGVALAQTSPFLTGATALQSNVLAWLTPIAIILVMVAGASPWPGARLGVGLSAS